MVLLLPEQLNTRADVWILPRSFVRNQAHVDQAVDHDVADDTVHLLHRPGAREDQCCRFSRFIA